MPDLPFINSRILGSAQNQAFGILEDDRMFHIHILGTSGMGQTTLLRNLILQDILDKEGLIFFDSGNELMDSILPFIPPHRIGDVIGINDVTFERVFQKDPNLLNEHTIEEYQEKIVSTFKYMKILDEKKVIAVNLESENLVNLILNAVYELLDERQGKQEYLRHRFFIYLSDFKNFDKKTFSEALEISRDGNFAFILCNETLSELPSSILTDIYGTFGTFINFKLVEEDKEKLSEVHSNLNSIELTNLVSNEFIINLLVNKNKQKSFKAKLLSLDFERFNLEKVVKKV